MDIRTLVKVAVEGDSDQAVAERLLAHVGLSPWFVRSEQGKGNLDRDLAGFNNDARRCRWLVLRDLDRVECAPPKHG